MIFSENRFPLRIGVRGRRFPDHALTEKRTKWDKARFVGRACPVARLPTGRSSPFDCRHAALLDGERKIAVLERERFLSE